VFAACAVLLGAAGGGYALFGRGPGATATIAAPGCTTATAAARPLTQVHLHLVTTGAKPFDVVAANNGYGFVSLGNGLAVMRTVTAVPALVHTLSLSQAYGEALTHDQRYLLVSGQSGLTVFRVRDLENGNYTPAGTLTSPGGKHAVQVAVSRDDRYAFVTLQYSAHVAVFNLRRALTSGFGPADLVGQIPVGAQPVGITASPDGRYLYVATGLATPARSSGRGTVTVLDLRKAETSPGSSSVLKVVGAGCGPDRIAVSADGRTVWVTVGGGNALVAYSAAKLLSDPRHALIARVAVGQLPLGLMIVKNGSRIIVADSNRDQVAGGASNLAVVDVGKALAGKPALLGVIASGGVPRQFAAEPGGKTLLVANTGSGQVQVVKLAHLP
jgi:DNA-binding beta-propeller fold protein YncE